MLGASKGAAVATRRARPKRDDAEQAFLASYDATKYERPSVAVDVVVLTAIDGALKVALAKRTEHPFKGKHALPGGFVRIDESLDDAALRILREKAGLRDVFLEQLYTFGDLGRDPRGRVVAIAYYALVAPAKFGDVAQAVGTVRVPWKGETGGPVDVVDNEGRALELAFDHADVLGLAVKRIRGKIDYAPIGFQLLPNAFTLRELQDVYETVLGDVVNKDSFRRRMLQSGLVEATGARERDVGYRPAELYRFVRRSAV
jgi:8-oxo-dGTP diphosphatase